MRKKDLSICTEMLAVKYTINMGRKIIWTWVVKKALPLNDCSFNKVFGPIVITLSYKAYFPFYI